MTTIAYRDGVMAGDTRALGFDKVPVGSKTKVYRLDDGRLFGISTNIMGLPPAVRRWVVDGMKPDAIPIARDTEKIDFAAMIVGLDGLCTFLDGNWLPNDPVTAPYYAVGSGKDFALTAMLLGQSAEDAVRTASLLDPWTGTDVTAVKHGE